MAAGGQEIQAPMANRLWHGEFPMDHETWCDLMVSDFPAPASMGGATMTPRLNVAAVQK